MGFCMTRVLFLLKRREDFNNVIHNNIGLTTGLYSSAKFVNDMLSDHNIESNLEVIIDNNDIDRVVTKYRPNFCIIEALYVTPTKFPILIKLHPNVTWIIRLHSQMPFMAGEGVAMDWIGDYSNIPNVVIAANAPNMFEEIYNYIRIKNRWTNKQTDKKVIYLPNYYPQQYKKKQFNYNKEVIDISCFGAIRPLKNHLLQAHAALKFADKLGKKLRFHVNAGRIEMKGEPIINNLKGLFQQLAESGHQLVNHQWAPREQFLKICETMDIGLQVSFSETFNIVAADLVSQGVPIIGSDEIPWLNRKWSASPVNTNSIVDKLYNSYNNPLDNVTSNQSSLDAYTYIVPAIWANYITGAIK